MCPESEPNIQFPQARPVPEPQYCTPEEVAMTLDLPEWGNDQGFFTFSDISHPSRDQVCRMILANEGIIDRRARRSWRVNQVKDFVTDIPTYFQDEYGFRSGYYANGGDVIHLRRDILPWDPSKGDKLEFRTVMNAWRTVSDVSSPNDETPPFWFDYHKGRLFIRTRRLQSKWNAVRITYRYGSEEPVPYEVNRLCCLMTAIQVLNMQAFAVKVGLGGDIAGIKADIIHNWQEEINAILSSVQRAGTVHGVPHR